MVGNRSDLTHARFEADDHRGATKTQIISNSILRRDRQQLCALSVSGQQNCCRGQRRNLSIGRTHTDSEGA